MREARTVVKAEKAGGLMKLVGDVGRVQAKAGTQAALDGLKIAQGPREMARIAKLAEKKGSKTRAILKTLGRGAILLSLATFNLAAWIMGAILTLFGFVSSAKSGVERLTQRSIDRGKARRLARYEAMMANSGPDPRHAAGARVARRLYLPACRVFHHGSVETRLPRRRRGRADRADPRLRLHRRR